jgi:hypothetical protein
MNLRKIRPWQRDGESPVSWARTTLWSALAATAHAIVAAVIIGVIWDGGRAFNVSYYWIGMMLLVLTSDLRPPLNTPRSALPHVPR